MDGSDKAPPTRCRIPNHTPMCVGSLAHHVCVPDDMTRIPYVLNTWQYIGTFTLGHAHARFVSRFMSKEEEKQLSFARPKLTGTAPYTEPRRERAKPDAK